MLIIKNEEKLENQNITSLKEQLETLQKASKHKEIIDIITNLPKEQLTFDMVCRLAAAYNNNEEYKKGLSALMQVKDEGENSALWNYHAGISCYYLQKYKEAEKYLIKALEIYPDFDDTSSLLYCTYIKLFRKKLDEKKFSKACEYLNKCRPLIKNNEELINFESELSYLYRLQNECGKAYENIEKVMLLGRNDSWVYSEAGLCLFELEQYNKAMVYLEKSLALGKNDNWLYYYAALCADSLDDNEKQLKYLEEGVKLYPDDADLNYVFGVYYINKREFGKALECLNKATEYDDKAELYTLTGLCNEKLGKYDEAFDYYKKALSFKDLPEIRKHISTLKKKEYFLLFFKILLAAAIIKVLIDFIF